MTNLRGFTKKDLITHYMYSFNCSRDEAMIMVEEDLQKETEKELEKQEEQEETREELIAELMETHYYSYEEAMHQVLEWEQADEAAEKAKKEEMGRNSKKNRKNRQLVHTNQKKTVDEYLKDYKIYVVGDAKHYISWTKMQLVDSMEEANLVMFTGGADVNPELYGEEQHRRTHTNIQRDAVEIEAFRKAKELNKRMIGICRGSQFLCVMSGGKLVQHCTGHTTPHRVTCLWKKNPTTIVVTSTHHQMMYPFDMDNKDYAILGYSSDKLSKQYENGDNEKIQIAKDFVEPEIVLFPKTNVLGIQGHPENMHDKYSLTQLRELLLSFMTVKNVNLKKKYEAVS